MSLPQRPLKSNERYLASIRETVEDYEAVEDAIISLIKREIYFPLLRIIDKNNSALKNSLFSLVDAIIQGEVEYDKDGFVGAFTSRISREIKELGGHFDKANGKWRISAESLSSDVRTAIELAQRKKVAIKRQLAEKLSQMDAQSISEKLHTKRLFEKVAGSINSQFKESIRKIRIAPEMSEAAKRRISEEYSQNMALYVKNFTEEQTKELRRQIEDMVFEGRRYESIIGLLQQQYGIARRKAHFLARQETSLLSSKIRETRYADAGIDDYEWQCVSGSSAEHPVRPMHLALKGTRQKFSAPPVVNQQGDKRNPGEDYNCRCVARPIVKF